MEKDVSRNIEEQLSAFLDGELPEEELQLLVRRLERNEEHRATLVRYSMIGNLLRQDPTEASSVHFRSRIMAAIDDEGGPQEEPAAQPRAARGWLPPMAAAVAIGLAIAGVMNTGMFNVGETISTNPQAAAVSSAVIAVPSVRAVGAVVDPGRQPAGLNRDRLTSYMVSHRQYAPSFQGPMANSRIFVRQARFEQ